MNVTTSVFHQVKRWGWLLGKGYYLSCCHHNVKYFTYTFVHTLAHCRAKQRFVTHVDDLARYLSSGYPEHLRSPTKNSGS